MNYNGHTLSSSNEPFRRPSILEIVRLKGNEVQKLIAYSPHMLGFFTHYNGNKTVPCYADHSKCPGGHTEATLRQFFLLHGYSVLKKKPVFFYITPGAAEQVLAQTPTGCTLRGRWMVLTRSEKTKGRLTADVGEKFHGEKELPVPLDPYPSIFNWMKIPLPDQGEHPGLSGDSEVDPSTF